MLGRLIGFVLSCAAWLFVVTYALLAVTMGGCRAGDPGCDDPSHVVDATVVLAVGVAGFIALVWWFLIRRRRA